MTPEQQAYRQWEATREQTAAIEAQTAATKAQAIAADNLTAIIAQHVRATTHLADLLESALVEDPRSMPGAGRRAFRVETGG